MTSIGRLPGRHRRLRFAAGLAIVSDDNGFISGGPGRAITLPRR